MKHFFLPLMLLRSLATGKYILLGPSQFIFFLVCACMAVFESHVYLSFEVF